ncbi:MULTISPECIES: hypothetical protein [Micromonospora]|uniref:Uncharacterized protein n=1 Tax=Micromonospora chersina TaxID=47854 RepID=A0A1C6USY5_9ACTN|nr:MULTISPECIES: hypothetical protein [Micromonospora]PSK63410.1 hypothetical protein B0E53_04657 [Micromonospora sp. MH33]SCL57154.1 hypothetical protein GA0070603_2358 [Micromonospora chersina]
MTVDPDEESVNTTDRDQQRKPWLDLMHAVPPILQGLAALLVATGTVLALVLK